MIMEEIAWDAITETTVWDLLSRRQRVDILLRDAPYEKSIALREMVSRLNRSFSEIEKSVLSDLDSIPRDVPIEVQYSIAETFENSNILLSILDGNDYAEMIWNAIKPESSGT